MEDDPRYPVGHLRVIPDPSTGQRRDWIEAIRRTPEAIRLAVAGLGEAQLDTPYREGGWTVRQLVHHVADSHLNAYVRFRLALTEDGPTIRPYDQDAWATLPDASGAPIDLSLRLLDALHARWALLLDAMAEADFARPLHHPESGAMDLDALLQTYAWHGRHHAAHVTSLRERNGWA